MYIKATLYDISKLEVLLFFYSRNCTKHHCNNTGLSRLIPHQSAASKTALYVPAQRNHAGSEIHIPISFLGDKPKVEILPGTHTHS